MWKWKCLGHVTEKRKGFVINEAIQKYEKISFGSLLSDGQMGLTLSYDSYGCKMRTNMDSCQRRHSSISNETRIYSAYKN